MDYTKTKIYKIWSTQGPDIYIGSTTKDYLSQRMSLHRRQYTHYKKGNKCFITSFLLFDKYKLENCFIELIESKQCSNKDEKNQLEGQYIRSLDCINKNIPNRRKKEYQQEYQQINKDKIKEYKKKYCEDNKEKIKEYYNINKDIKIKQSKINYQKNRDKLLEKITCECGSICSLKSKAKHLNTLKHQNFIKTIN